MFVVSLAQKAYNSKIYNKITSIWFEFEEWGKLVEL